jgi:site-specific DNA-methyltransferase (adenine-specific)
LNIKNGNSLDLLKDVKSDSMDCMVTDPPYGISFMNKDWDKAVPDIAIWKECIRAMKPGAFAFVMCSPRSDVQAEMVIKLKEARFDVGFTPIYWVYASGFPKATSIGKSIDRKLGYVRTKIRIDASHVRNPKSIEGGHGIEGGDRPWMKKALEVGYHEADSNIPVSEEAKRLDGSYSGFQPKPSVEVIIVAMKPLFEKTYVDQALKNGKGITWLDDGRIPYQSNDDFLNALEAHREPDLFYKMDSRTNKIPSGGGVPLSTGRFPANLLVQDNAIDNGIISKSGGVGGRSMHGRGEGYGFRPMGDASPELPSDEGSLSRYFSLDAWYSKNIEELPDYVQRIFPFLYVPKASNSERSDGLDIFEEQTVDDGRNKSIDNALQRGETLRKNTHPTVKPLKLMTYLITIGSRPGDTILDPFMGSGTTGVAAKMLHRNFIGFEIEGKYFEIAKERIEKRAATRDIFEFDAMKEMEYEEK